MSIVERLEAEIQFQQDLLPQLVGGRRHICLSRVDLLKDAIARIRELEAGMRWHDGCPPHPWNKELFIAKTSFGDKVVLRSLPEEYSYDFATADDTYIKKDKIISWMQFPDSIFAPYQPPAEAQEADHE